jgi:hypothetical protein
MQETESVDRELDSMKRLIVGLERQKQSIELELLREEMSRSFTAIECSFPVSF